MLNKTNEVRFHISGEQLNTAIKDALNETAIVMLKFLGMENINLSKITSKTNIQGSFSKFVLGCTLDSDKPFDENYVSNAFDYWSKKKSSFNRQQFEYFMRNAQHPNLTYTKVFASNSLTGLGMFLLRLHALKWITLPAIFDWPGQRGNVTEHMSAALCSPNEVLSFIRSVNPPTDDKIPDEAFGKIGHDQNRAQMFGTRGTKVILALGWSQPEDINIPDCDELHAAFADIGVKSLTGTMSSLLSTLKAKFGERAKCGDGEWMYQRRGRIAEAVMTKVLPAFFLENSKAVAETVELEDQYNLLLKSDPNMGNFSLIEKRRLAGVIRSNDAFDFSTWIALEDCYLTRNKFESRKNIENILGVFGIYLFFYLPKWFKKFESSELEYPDTPNKMLPGLFLNRLIKHAGNLPITFIEFVNERAIILNHSKQTHYRTIITTSKFLDFIEENALLLPNSDQFKNTLTRLDRPTSGRLNKTNKRALPQSLFTFYIKYLWCIKEYIDLMVERAVEGTLSSTDFDRLKGGLNVVDTFSKSTQMLGYTPVLIWGGKCIPIRYISYLPTANIFKLRDGRYVRVPCPHGINQILCALLTGLRHTHIQWLDYRTFDKFAKDDELDLTLLYVNTDKVREDGWTPYVNASVIKILRSQARWRDMVDDAAFSRLHMYNNNEESNYPAILPLFAYGTTGTPHGDEVYNNAWFDCLSDFQGLLVDIFKEHTASRAELVQLQPGNIKYNDPNRLEQLEVWYNTKQIQVELKIRTDMTAHSSRVSFVTHTLPHLSAELIGEHFTGQSPGTVIHYNNPSKEDQRASLLYQGVRLRDLALEGKAIKLIADPSKHSTHHIQADVNSTLAGSMRLNLEGTIIDYGMISLVIHDDDATGLDVLRERGLSTIAFNKTEICPFDNTCPADVVVLLKGIHRCSLCPYAVRSIDHLPAVVARKKQQVEILYELDRKFEEPTRSRYSEQDLTALERDRQRLSADIAGWEASEQILEVTRERIAAGADTRKWVVERPDIIKEELQRIETPNSGATYLLTRLAECVSYPNFQSPHVAGFFEAARRRILASAGQLDRAFSMQTPADAAAECAGLIRSIVESNKLTNEDVIRLLDTESHLEQLPKSIVLGVGYDYNT